MDRAPATPPSRLAAEFPSVAQLPRDELHELMHEPDDVHARSDQEAHLAALVHSLPDVRSLYDEHQQLLEEVERAAGTSFSHAARNSELRPALENVREQTRAAHEQARMAEAAWPAIEAEMSEAYKVSFRN